MIRPIVDGQADVTIGSCTQRGSRLRKVAWAMMRGISGLTPEDLTRRFVAAVLRSEPDWSRLPGETPREVSTLLRRCLEKDPRRRLSPFAARPAEIAPASGA